MNFVFSFLRFLNFGPVFFGHIGKRVDKEVNVNFKIHGVINCKRNNCNILPNISRTKGNQAMTFGQLTGYTMRHNFLGKPYVGEKLILIC